MDLTIHLTLAHPIHLGYFIHEEVIEIVLLLLVVFPVLKHSGDVSMVFSIRETNRCGDPDAKDTASDVT